MTRPAWSARLLLALLIAGAATSGSARPPEADSGSLKAPEAPALLYPPPPLARDRRQETP